MAVLNSTDVTKGRTAQQRYLAGLGQDIMPADVIYSDGLPDMSNPSPGITFDDIVSGATTLFKTVQTVRAPATTPAKTAATAKAANMQVLLIPGLAIVALLVLMKRR